MHSIQRAILELATTQNLRKKSLREIGKLASGRNLSPQLVQYHIQRLLEMGFLRVDERRDVIERVSHGEKRASFVSLPIVGTASCGPATQIAEQDIEGHLRLSEKYLPKNREGLFVIRAVGTSMNRAKVNGTKEIHDGDFVVVDGRKRQPENGAYVLAIADGCANVKKYVKDKNGQVMLLSESSDEFPPIYVHPDDQLDFFINGRVLDVLKKPENHLAH